MDMLISVVGFGLKIVGKVIDEKVGGVHDLGTSAMAIGVARLPCLRSITLFSKAGDNTKDYI